MTRAVVIGLDGAGYQLLGDWLEDGTLPTLSRLQETGRWGRLRSSYPPVTCPAWRCYSTGMNPGKLGVFWWEQLDRQEREFTVPSADSFDAPDIWDRLGHAGFESAVVNMPTTRPPRPIDGWLVGSEAENGTYASPASLQDELDRELDYHPTFPDSIRTLPENPERISDVLDVIDERFAAARYLRDEHDPDFLHLTLFLTNAVQHYFWDDDVLERLWQHVDGRLDEFLTGEETVLVMSDHGSNRIETVFNINTWLEEQGYLVTETSASDVFSTTGIDRDTVLRLVDRAGLTRLVKEFTPQSLLDYATDVLPASEGGVRASAKASKVDWDRSDAVASGQGPVYVLATGDRRQRVKADLKQELADVAAPDGSPVAREVLDAAAVYDGPYVDNGPDLVVDQADHVHIPGTVGADSTFVPPDEWKWRCENHRDGLFIAAGPDITAEGQLSDQPTLYDLAPTLLHLFGCPVPEELDGAVLRELFAPGSDPATRDVQYTDQPLGDGPGTTGSADDDDAHRRRLEDLGYLSE